MINVPTHRPPTQPMAPDYMRSFIDRARGMIRNPGIARGTGAGLDLGRQMLRGQNTPGSFRAGQLGNVASNQSRLQNQMISLSGPQGAPFVGGKLTQPPARNIMPVMGPATPDRRAPDSQYGVPFNGPGGGQYAPMNQEMLKMQELLRLYQLYRQQTGQVQLPVPEIDRGNKRPMPTPDAWHSRQY